MTDQLKARLEEAEIGYKAAMDAMPYMPKESRPYTQQTADHHLVEIDRIKAMLNAAKGE